MTLQAKLIGVILLLLAIAGTGAAGWHYGNVYGANAEKVRNQAAEIGRKDVTITALQQAAKENEAKAKADALAAKQEAQKYEKEIADIRARAAADAARRVRIDPNKFCSGHVTGTTQATSAGGDGQNDPGAAFLPEPFAGNLRQLAADADEVAADLRTLKARVEQAGCFAGG